MNGGNRLKIAILALVLALPMGASDLQYVYPGEAWPAPEVGAWNRGGLDGVAAKAKKLGTGGLMIVDHGRLVLQFGNVKSRRLVQSQRKALLGAAFGVAVDKGEIDLDATLEDLGIDDDPKLTEAEKQARVEDLLQSRSGVYHSAIYEFPGWKKRKPERGSHEPGETFFYNNWDFNVLGTIFEKRTGKSIGDGFNDWIAKPTGMQDFRPKDVSYLTRRNFSEKKLQNESNHAAYIFHMSTRDMARFGLLYLSRGEWNGNRVLSSEWVERSWSYRPSGMFPDGYGYLWFIVRDEGFLARGGLTEPIYVATGAGGHKVVVIPELDLVVAHSVATRGVGLLAQMKRRFLGRHSVGDREFYGLLLDIVRAHPRNAN